MRQAKSQGFDWRAVIDGLRPQIQRLWLEMPEPERRRFLRHLRPWWDVHRHRAAPKIFARIEDAQRRGQLHISAARIGQIEPCIGTVQVALTPKHGAPFSLTVERVIDCSGLQSDFAKIDRPLIRQLLNTGHIRADSLRLGLDIARGGAVINAQGIVHADLFAIGPLTKGALWEITAVPDIRIACEQMAAQLLLPARQQKCQSDESAPVLPFSSRKADRPDR
jgi:uncharacterized NAD(P)/FAD-binding protein YdhS